MKRSLFLFPLILYTLMTLLVTLSATLIFPSISAAGDSSLLRTYQGVALVYDGPGACKEKCAQLAADIAERVGLEVRFINAQTWSEEKFVGARVWLQPGGKSITVARTLNAEQKARIRRFVAEGNGYVGFCAGGFLASAKIRGLDNQIYPDETLALVPLISAPYVTDDEAAIYEIDWAGLKRYLYWEGGPHFEVPGPADVEIMATYSNGQVAAVRNPYGLGRVYVVGPHPEASQDWRDYFKLQDHDGMDLDVAADMVRWVLDGSTTN